MAKTETSTETAAGLPQEQFLIDAGFVYDAYAHWDGVVAAHEIGMNRGGAYDHRGVYAKGAVTVKIEQNTDTQTVDGLRQTTQHPAVAIISGPKGSVAANPEDQALVLLMVDELA